MKLLTSCGVRWREGNNEGVTEKKKKKTLSKNTDKESKVTLQSVRNGNKNKTRVVRLPVCVSNVHTSQEWDMSLMRPQHRLCSALLCRRQISLPRRLLDGHWSKKKKSKSYFRTLLITFRLGANKFIVAWENTFRYCVFFFLGAGQKKWPIGNGRDAVKDQLRHFSWPPAGITGHVWCSRGGQRSLACNICIGKLVKW